MSGALRDAVEAVLTERASLVEARDDLDERIERLTEALALLGYAEGKTPTGRDRRPPAPDSVEGLLRRWVDDYVAVDTEWTFDDALSGILALGWSTSAERPLDSLRPHIARLAREGAIRRVRRGWYVVPGPFDADETAEGASA